MSSGAAVYSTFKAAWHIDRIEQLRRGQVMPPVELQFILSDLCNQDCYFCAYRAETGLSTEQFVEWKKGKRIHNPNRMMTHAKAIEILDDAAEVGVKSVIFTGGGEPTVHPNHLEVFAHALDLGFECSLNTNGLLLRKGWEDVYPLFTYIRFSIDAGCEADYKRVRQVPAGQYKTVIGNLEKVVQVSEGTGCVVGAGYVVTPDNWQMLVPGLHIIRDTGAAYVRLASMQSTKQFLPFLGVLQRVREELVRAESLGTGTFQVVNLFEAALGRTPAEKMCGMQYFVVYIGANLKLYRCCYTAYTQQGDIGSLRNQTFASWLYSAARKTALDKFDARSCTICPLEDKNETIRYMVDPAPPHVNFV